MRESSRSSGARSRVARSISKEWASCQRFAIQARRQRLVGTVMAGALLIGSVGVAHAAALTTPACLAKKLKEWGKLRKCQATENGKALQAKPADPAKCQTKFDAKLATLNAQATAAAIACRYGVNGDGTVTDYDTGLQWEQKTDDGSVHDKDNEYDWSHELRGTSRTGRHSRTSWGR